METVKNFTKILNSTKTLHAQLDQHTFLKRYENDSFNLEDRYKHLLELLPIYQAIEAKMRAFDFSSDLESYELSELLTRSKTIENDLIFIQRNNHIKLVKHNLTAATQAYIKKINSISDPEEILSHFYVRILGDLHGGPLTKKHVVKLYKLNDMYNEVNNNNTGVEFYIFSENVSKKFHYWLNAKKLSDESFQYANEAFNDHLHIFDELEKNRAKTGKAYFNFFNTKNALIATAAVTTVAAIGLTMRLS